MGSLLVQTILKSLKADHAAVPAILKRVGVSVSTCSSERSLNDPSRAFAPADHIFIAMSARGRLDGANESEPFVQTRFHPSCLTSRMYTDTAVTASNENHNNLVGSSTNSPGSKLFWI